MSDKYFQEAQRKILTVSEGDWVTKGTVDVARKIYEEAQALKPVDERLSDDPLTALAAVMRENNIKIYSNSCGAIRDGSEGTNHLFVWCGDQVLEHKFTTCKDVVEITADDIKPESE